VNPSGSGRTISALKKRDLEMAVATPLRSWRREDGQAFSGAAPIPAQARSLGKPALYASQDDVTRPALASIVMVAASGQNASEHEAETYALAC